MFIGHRQDDSVAVGRIVNLLIAALSREGFPLQLPMIRMFQIIPTVI